MGCRKLKYYEQKRGLEKVPSSFLRVVGKEGGEAKSRVSYFTGGMIMPGLNYQGSTGYRFGYQGSEKDDEIAGVSNGHFTTFYREGDTRILRWWSVDPKTRLQPWQSSYSYMDGNPIRYNDPLGDWVKGAGFFRNLFNSDSKILAKDKAKATGGTAFKDGKGWTVNYTTTETTDLGNGPQTMTGLTVEHYNKRGGSKFLQAGDQIDNYMKGPGILADWDRDLHGGKAPLPVQVIANLNPLVSVPSGAKVLYENHLKAQGELNGYPEDIFGNEASSKLDVGVAAFSIIAPLNPGANVSKAVLGKSSAGEILDGVQKTVDFVNSTGALQKLKTQDSEKKKSGE